MEDDTNEDLMDLTFDAFCETIDMFNEFEGAYDPDMRTYLESFCTWDKTATKHSQMLQDENRRLSLPAIEIMVCFLRVEIL